MFFFNVCATVEVIKDNSAKNFWQSELKFFATEQRVSFVDI